MSLCKFKYMDECGLQYCDFWNQAKRTCALALEAHQRVEMLDHINKILERIESSNTEKGEITLIKHLASLGLSVH